MKKRIGLTAFGVLISATALGWVAKGIEWPRLGSVLAGLPIWVPMALVALYLFSFVPRAYRSLWMLKSTSDTPLSLMHLGEAQVMGYAANNVLPLRLGEIVRVFALRQLAGIPGLTGLGSLLAERILDGAVVVLILGGTVSWYATNGRSFGQTAVEPLLYTGIALFSGAIVGLFAIALLSEWIAKQSERWLPARIHNAVSGILNALAFFRNTRQAMGVVVISGLIWLIEGFVFVLAGWSLGLANPFAPGFFMLAVVNLGILLPSAPGYVGVFQACGMLAFQLLGFPREQGLATSLLVHASQYLPITALGLLCATRHGWSLRSMASTPAPSSTS